MSAAPAFAQTAPETPAAVPASAQDTQDANADPAATADIVVSGIRQSLSSAQNIKKNSDQQIDAIVAEDIGKLPDVALSDTAARIAGVQVDRGGGEAGRVLVRGLPDFTTTFNGREIFTAEARSVALQDFPSGLIGAVEIYKTTTSDLIEGGLAGEINVRSRRPFDFNGFTVAGSLWGQYEKRSTQFDPNGNLLVSDRWNTGIGEIGALVSVSYTQLRYLDSTRSNTDFIAGNVSGANASAPDIQRIDYGQGDRTRPSVSASLQWRPATGLEFYVDALYQGFRNKVSDRDLTVPLWGGTASNPVVNSAGQIESITVTDPFRPDGFQGATYGKTDTYQYAIGGKYDADRFHLSADLARTASRFLDSIYSFDMAYAAPVTVNADTGLNGKDGPYFTFGGNVDPTSPSNYIFRGFFDRQLIARGEDWQFRTDASYDLADSGITKIAAGFRYVDRDAHFEDGSRYFYDEPARLPLSGVPGVSYEVFHSGFPSNDPIGVRGYYTPTYDSIRDSISQIRQFAGFAAGSPPPDPLVTYSANEKSYAGYGQVKYAFGEAGGLRVDGVVGLRYVRTELAIDGTSSVGGTLVPTSTTKSYDDWLPNASARLRFTDQLQLRLSYTKTRSRPGFAQYNPGQAVDPPPSGCTQNTTNCIRNANGGNPDLNPLKSNNYDASLEYYFSSTGSISAAVFRRDLNGFIQNYQTFITDPVYGVVRVNRPFNTGKGRIDGLEAQVTTFLDFGPTWLHAFGAQANVTYLDAKTGFPAALGAGVTTEAPIVGVSKWAFNLAGFYEKNGLSVRLSYNYRDAFPSSFQVRGPDIYRETTRGIGRLDLSASYDVVKNFTVFADWVNMLAKPYRSDLTYDYANGTSMTFPRAVRYEETVFSGGIRFRF
jgi:TonB-dependent receptor